MSSSSGRGRPAKPQIDAREALLTSAKRCFTQLSYEKVTTRKLADEAGVNVGMIRYYFGSKQGLYETMFADMIDNVIQHLKNEIAIEQMDSFVPLFNLQTEFIAQYPEFPMLVQKELWGKGHCQQHLTDLLMLKLHPLLEEIFVSMKKRGKLKLELDLMLLRISVISLLIFPFLSRPASEKIDKVPFDALFLQRLATHNAQLLEQGSLLTSPNRDN
ncbi:MAG: TetR/AcrR family transcriptional regulator [Aestuariibacter sp.]